MNRFVIVAVALCVLLLATVGAGASAAEEKLPPQYRVVQYDVTYSGGVVGKLSVNTNTWTYVLNTHGLQPDTEYYLYCQGEFPYINNETTNEDGDLHMQGEWPQKINVVAFVEWATPEFALTDEPLTGSNTKPVLEAYYWFTPFLLCVHGHLYEPSNYYSGIANQTIEIRTWSIIKGEYTHWATVTTDESGVFEVIKPATMRLQAPLVYTPCDPEYYTCYPYCCTFINNEKPYQCVYAFAEWQS